MAGLVTEYLRTEVYPNLDAVQCGLLDHLKPRKLQRYYVLTCPTCGKPEAFYYPGSAIVHCNRRNNCSQLTISLWDILVANGKSKRDVLAALCEGAGVPLPRRSDEDKPAQRDAVPLGRAFMEVIRECLGASQTAQQYLTSQAPAGRGMTQAEIADARIGYYPSTDIVRDKLKAKGADLKRAEEWGLIGDSAYKFSKRIVGYWEQPDGSIRLWGRGFGQSLQPYMREGELFTPPKYDFAFGMLKTVPYRFLHASHKGLLIAIEGAMDVERMAIHGIPAVGVGGDSVIAAQAAFMSSRGVQALVHVTDGDKAGYQGALKSIRSCEPLGISVYVAIIPPGMDDPDTLIGRDGPAPVLKLIEDAMGAGTFIARDVALATELYGHQAPRAVQRRLELVETLTPASQIEFAKTMKMYGLPVPDRRASALRQAAALLDAGVSEPEAWKVILQQFGLEISLLRKQEDDNE